MPTGSLLPDAAIDCPIFLGKIGTSGQILCLGHQPHLPRLFHYAQIDNEDIKNFVLETYRPLTSPDGKGNWTNMQPFSVLFPLSVYGKRGVWVETTLRHFSFKAIAKKIPKNILKLAKQAVGLSTTSGHSYESWAPTGLKIGNEDSRKRMVRFCNYTQASDFPPSLNTSSSVCGRPVRALSNVFIDVYIIRIRHQIQPRRAQAIRYYSISFFIEDRY